ncbi:Hsp70 family protein [Actinocrispum sp. NPDC049592]|uniref:Hsp70 family protein n=1 Tax=Actinocrispum sp. NPDC049592 TaxID=3154835 RepID=UPI00343E99FD
MPYRLGIDLGTTFTAAALCRPAADDTVVSELVPLHGRASSVPSVLFLAGESTVVGAAAERRALSDPARVVRDFKRRIGDAIPIMAGGVPHQAHDLAATLVRWVVDRVVEREGEAPDAIAVTHPACWGEHRQSLLRNALSEVDLGDVVLLTEPQAAAMQYASAERIPDGSTIAVYDLGGGTFDAAVVRKAGGFELLGPPAGLDRLGGVDFDDALLGLVQPEIPADADPVAMARLRRECTAAKEALSEDEEVTVPLLGNGYTEVTRARFESTIRPVLAETVDCVARTVRAAGLSPDELTAVLLVGGSSRIPLVTTMIEAAFGRPVAVDADPKGVVALGAALAAHRSVIAPDGFVPAPRRPDYDDTPPEIDRPKVRLRRAKIVIGSLVMLVAALAVIPSPFSADSGNPAPATAGVDVPAGSPPVTGGGAPGTTQAGVTKKKTTPAQDSADDRDDPDARGPEAGPAGQAPADRAGGAGSPAAGSNSPGSNSGSASSGSGSPGSTSPGSASPGSGSPGPGSPSSASAGATPPPVSQPPSTHPPSSEPPPPPPPSSTEAPPPPQESTPDPPPASTGP